MQKIKEAEVRKELMTILPEKFDWECRGKVKIRIYEIDKLVDYILASYNAGYTAGKYHAKLAFKKLVHKL